MKNHAVDTFRGIAILIMIAANSYSYIFSEIPCPLVVRVLFSSAAPIFIFLSGVSLRLSEENGKSILSNLQRISQIVFFAILIDVVIWEILPFYTMDVLYLISFSLIILLILRKLPDSNFYIFYFLITVLTLFFSPFYNFELIELTAFDLNQDYNLSDAMRHIFVDGWFPVFPWLSISILGFYLTKHKWKMVKYAKPLFITGLFGILGFLFLILADTFSFNLPRNQYMEIFYPVTLLFYSYMLFLLLFITYFIIKNRITFNYLGLFGNYSLSVYFFHILLIRFYLPIFDFQNHKFSVFELIAIFSSLYMLVFSFVFLLILLEKKTGKNLPIVKFLIGI